MKNKYDTSVVFLYALGKEELLPPGFRKQIPYSTISSWRRIDCSKYIGHEFRYFFDDAFNKAELQFRYRNLRQTMSAFARSWVLLQDALFPLVKKASQDKDMQRQVLIAIGYMQKHIGIERALRLLGLSRTLYHQWILEARFDCFDSFAALCVKRHPHQLGLEEVKKMKTILTDTELDHWPIVSVAGLALRKKSIIASLYTWYKYARLLNIKRKTAKKDRKTVGLIATRPNEYLHVDTTYFPLIDGKSICITFVMDNYSKMILGFHVADHLSFEVVKKALAKALEVIATHPDQRHSFLVADGGRENHNKRIDEFVRKLSGYRLTKIRALKDIRFSNCPVEAVHRTVKTRYLRGRNFESVEALSKYLDWVVKDYNELRPHYKHRPRTPYEVYFSIPLGFDIRQRVMEAIKKRVRTNKNAKCIQCKGFKVKDVCGDFCSKTE